MLNFNAFQIAREELLRRGERERQENPKEQSSSVILYTLLQKRGRYRKEEFSVKYVVDDLKYSFLLLQRLTWGISGREMGDSLQCKCSFFLSVCLWLQRRKVNFPQNIN